MKYLNIIILNVFLVSGISFHAQTYPKFINYQAIAHDINGEALNQQDIHVRIGIIETSMSGTISFQEDHELTTSSVGLFSLLIGSGTPTANGLLNQFANIAWESADYYLNVQIDNGFGYEDLGTQQLVSVPYAFQAKKAETVMYPTLSTLADLNDGTFIYFNEAGISNTFDANTFITAGNNITLSGTGLNSNPYVINSNFTEVDGSTTNEIQDISINGTDLTISSGSTIDLSGLSGTSHWNTGTNGVGNSVIFNTNDYVGIGTNSPLFPLHVSTSSSDRSAYFYNNTTTSNDSYGLYSGAWGSGSGDNYAGAFDAVGTSGTNYAIRAYASGGATNWAGYFIGNVSVQGSLKIDDGSNSYTLPGSDGSANQLMSTDGAGNLSWQTQMTSPWTQTGANIYQTVLTDNVGIGTTAPGKISGSSKYLTLSRGDGAGGPSTNDNVSLELHGGSSSPLGVQSKIEFIARSTNGFDINTGRIELTNTSGNTGKGIMRFYTNPGSGLLERLTITETGEVGIGTSSPSAKLDVNGTITISNSTGKINSVNTGSANLVPIAYGNISSTGLINSGTGNFSCTYNSSLNRYEINITGNTYFWTNFITNVTTMSPGVYATTSSMSGELIIVMSSNSQAPFQFIVYKP